MTSRNRLLGSSSSSLDPEVDVIVMSPLEVTGWDQVLADAAGCRETRHPLRPPH